MQHVEVGLLGGDDGVSAGEGRAELGVLGEEDGEVGFRGGVGRVCAGDEVLAGGEVAVLIVGSWDGEVVAVRDGGLVVTWYGAEKGYSQC